MLECRLVHISLIGSSLTAKVVGCCPQCGVLSPLLWNLVADGLSIATNDLGFSTFGCADDIVIIVQGIFVHTVREIMQKALKVVDKWAVKEGLNISTNRTAIVSFTNRRKLEGLGPLIFQGKEFKMLDEVKYLGVILNLKLSWNQHLQKIIRKMQTTFAFIRCTYRRKWGLDLVWYIGSILGYFDPSYLMVPWPGGPRSYKKSLKFN
jgi:hypothetical protein